MIIAKAKLTGNCRRLKSNGKFIGIIGICGIKTSSPLYLPLMIVDSMTLFIKFFTASLVPLHSQGCYAAWLQLLLLIVNVRWESRQIHWIQKLCGIVDYVILVYNCVNWFEWKQLSRKKILNVALRTSTSLFLPQILLTLSANYGYWTVVLCPQKHAEKLLFRFCEVTEIWG